MQTLHQLRNIFSNIICSYLQDGSKSPEGISTEGSNNNTESVGVLLPEQQEILEKIKTLRNKLEGADGEKKYTKKAGVYLKQQLTKDPENFNDPEAIPTIELLKRFERQFNSAVSSSKNITNEIQELSKNVEQLGTSLESKGDIQNIEGGNINNNSISKEKLKTITNNEFLKLSKSERLQYVTKDNVDYENIVNGNIKEVTFFFDQDGNGKDDSDLYLMTTIGQLMGKEVGEVESGGEVYSRDGLNGEFFSGNKRLVIHTDTQININKVRTPEELKTLQDGVTKGFEKYKDEPNADIAKEALERGLDSDFAMLVFSDAVEGLTGEERGVKIEEIFTHFDRFRGDSSDWDGKKMENGKYPDELVVYLLREYSKDWENKAKEYGIDVTKIKEIESKKYTKFLDIDVNNLPEGDKGLLEFLSIAEGTHGNYNAIYGNGKQSVIDFRTMSLRDILAYQKTYKIGRGSAAIGKYQFMDYTLKDITRRYGISLDEKFTPEMQDRLALLKLKERGLDSFKSGKISQSDFQFNLSKEWAAIPKDRTGKSYYAGDGLNNAQVSNGQIGDILHNLKSSA